MKKYISPEIEVNCNVLDDVICVSSTFPNGLNNTGSQTVEIPESSQATIIDLLGE